MIIKLLDILRIVIVCLTFYFGYSIGFTNGYDPLAQLHFMIPVIIATIAGISGFEGLLFAKKSAEIKGFEVGSNYQRQSAIALLSYAVVAAMVYFFNWGIKAELTIFFAFIFFFIFSGVNHAIEAIKKKNYKWQNVNRPFITFILIAGMIYPIIMAIKML
ncbi:MAG: hypothetical protein A2X18_03285 [Bacteroidetes bacterium GWF2_40_14]|nr:MAG: hypothetical protein A2X18_03285 [Bacteroidetes bacterium GWF2_40_14]